MKIPVQAAFILSVVVTIAIAGCQKQIAAENRQQKEKPEHSTAIEQGKKPRYKKNVKRNDLIENGVFIQIPSPNPIITPGQTARKTIELEPKVRFIKVIVENMDQSENPSDVKVTAALGG